MAVKSLFDSIDVPEPCSQSWDAMIGDDQTRFCGSCEKKIYNLSAMSRVAAKKLLFQSNESVCVRMEKNADGKVETLKKRLHQITRQIPIAAGVLSASLTISAVASAQKRPPQPRIGKAAVSPIVNDEKSSATISGTVTDASGAVVPNVEIILRKANGKSVRKTVANHDGFYEFKDVAPSVYEISIAAGGGFNQYIKKSIRVAAEKNLSLPIILKESKRRRTIIGIMQFASEIVQPPKKDDVI